MFVMQAHVIREHIQRTIIGKRFRNRDEVIRIFCGLRLLVENVMLGDEMPGAGM